MPAVKRDKQPRRLRSLIDGDLINLNDSVGQTLLLTKIETKSIVKEYIESEFDALLHQKVNNTLKEIGGNADKRIEEIEKSVSAYIDYKFDKLSEKICELLLHRKFNEEVERKVKERLNKRGKF